MAESNHQYQEHLGAFDRSAAATPPTSFTEPPIPPNQETLELLNPIETLDELRDPESDVHRWLSFIKHEYSPPEETNVLLLYPCAAEKPMPESNTYQALSETLSQYDPAQQRRIHVVTVSEPMGVIPYEFQDGATWLYDNPRLFEWWVKNNDHEWNTAAQQQCLQILGEHIAGFIDRALTESWYDTHLACVRHMTANANESSDQTHRQMLETAEAITGASLRWLPTEPTVTALVENVGTMAWQMMGVSHDAIQTELASELDTALEPTD